MASTLYSVVALLTSIGILLIGNGLLGTVLSVRMGMEGFPTASIGVVMACYSVGFVTATLICGRLIQKVGHIRGFAALAAIGASVTLMHPLLISVPAWAVMRTVFGFSMAGLYMITESWLNDRTPREYRGQVLAIYSITAYMALGCGQFLLNLAPVDSYQLFSVSAILLACALIPVSITRARSPEIRETSALGVGKLYGIAPLGLVGASVAGLISGAFMGMGPIYGQQLGLSLRTVSIMMGVTILGGLVLQLPIGRVSDRFDRRSTIVGVAWIVVALSIAITLLGNRSHLLLIVLTATWGGFAFTLYPLSSALTNDFVEPHQVVAASGGLLLAYGVGMIAGPIFVSILMGRVGPNGLFWGLAAVSVLLGLFGVYRRRVGAMVIPAYQSEYVAVPRTTPYAAVLDPRVEGEQLEFVFDEPPNTGFDAGAVVNNGGKS